ncbi:MAG: signal peptidase I [Actinobacteria bacterium]|nr:signal peptidase I [Actinomycetota bacterium]
MDEERVRRPAAGIIRYASMFLIAIAMSCLLLLIVQSFFAPFHVIKSNSMAPQFTTGDAVVLKDIDPKDVKVGQVVIFRDPEDKGQFVIHRVLAIEEAGYTRLFTTKGDSNPVPDPLKTSSGDIVGGVAVKLPSFGVLLDFLASPKGYLSCAAIPAALSLLLVFVCAVVEKTSRERTRRRVFSPQTTAR